MENNSSAPSKQLSLILTFAIFLNRQLSEFNFQLHLLSTANICSFLWQNEKFSLPKWPAGSVFLLSKKKREDFPEIILSQNMTFRQFDFTETRFSGFDGKYSSRKIKLPESHISWKYYSEENSFSWKNWKSWLVILNFGDFETKRDWFFRRYIEGGSLNGARRYR